MKQKNNFVYRVFKNDEYEKFKNSKIVEGKEMDFESGFIHVSTKDQLKQTIFNYFNNDDNLVIVELRSSDLTNFLKWEVSTNNLKYPHFYNKLEFKWVNKVFSSSELCL